MYRTYYQRLVFSLGVVAVYFYETGSMILHVSANYCKTQTSLSLSYDPLLSLAGTS